MSIRKMVKTKKLYYVCITRSAYFPISRRLHWESKWQRGREKRRGERESELTGYLATSSEIWTYVLFLCALHLGHFIWQFRGVNLAAYLGTSSENLNSNLILVTSSDKFLGDKSCSLSGYFIWKFELTSDLGHFIWQVLRGVDLTTYLGTSSENLNSHLILVSSSDKLWGVDLTTYLGISSENLNSHLILVTSSDNFLGGISDLVEHFICKLDLPKRALTTILHITPGKYEPSWLKFQ